MTVVPAIQAPALNRRKVGEFVVTYLSDGFLDGQFGFLQGIEAGEAARLLEAAHRPPLPHFPLSSYLVQGGGRTVLVDVGTGGFGGWGGRFPAALAAAGVEPADVDVILVSHFHVDHVGDLTVHGRPAFPKAQVIAPEADARFWRDDGVMSQAGAEAAPFFLAAREAMDAYAGRLDLVGAGEVVPGITLVPLPGHTPGHSGFRVSSGADQLLLWTDIVHMPDVQVARPEVTMGFDVDPDAARATRLRLLDEVATDRVTVGGMHFTLPGFAVIEREAGGYRKSDLPWLPALL